MTKKYKVLFYPIAYNDLDEIFDYILEDNHSTAIETIDQIQAAIEKLITFPKIGSIPKDLRLQQMDYRMLVVDDYLVFYVVDEDAVRIRRILHGSRNYSHLM